MMDFSTEFEQSPKESLESDNQSKYNSNDEDDEVNGSDESKQEPSRYRPSSYSSLKAPSGYADELKELIEKAKQRDYQDKGSKSPGDFQRAEFKEAYGTELPGPSKMTFSYLLFTYVAMYVLTIIPTSYNPTFKLHTKCK